MGKVLTRQKLMNFYCLRPEDIKDGEDFPFCVTFKGTSHGTGKKLTTYGVKLKRSERPLRSKVFKLSAQLDKNEKGEFYVLDVIPSRDSTEAEVKAASSWHRSLMSGQAAGKVKVDESEVDQSNPGGVSEVPEGAGF